MHDYFSSNVLITYSLSAFRLPLFVSFQYIGAAQAHQDHVHLDGPWARPRLRASALPSS